MTIVQPSSAPLFIQIHTLTSYPASLLNRDDIGFAKRIPVGDDSRIRISSQCLKRHWRDFTGEYALVRLGEPSVRSRLTFEMELIQPLLAQGRNEPVVRTIVEALADAVLGKSEKATAKAEDAAAAKAEKAAEKASKAAAKAAEKAAKGGKEAPEPPPPVSEKPEPIPTHQTAQVVVLGRPEILYLLGIAKNLSEGVTSVDKAKEAFAAYLKENGAAMKANLKAMPCGAGLDAALFGRMVTSDFLATGEAALHVAHAFTVHAEKAEQDYFSALDDLTRAEGKMGSGHINSVELSTGLYYGYVVIDVPLLVSNVTGCDAKAWLKKDKMLAASVVESMIHLMATVSPGAKKGSTAPYSYASCVLVEVGTAQPSSYADAFLNAVRTTTAKPDILANTYGALEDFIGELDGMYGPRNERQMAAMKPTAGLIKIAERRPIADVAQWAAGRVREAK